jgi:hypothetical protein
MTAFAEHVLDTALAAANTSPWGRLCPPFHAILDELPSTAPLPTLRTRMANERALGSRSCGPPRHGPSCRDLRGAGSPHPGRPDQQPDRLRRLQGCRLQPEISDLLGQVRISRTGWQTGQMGGRQVSADDISILTPAEVRQLKERHALVLSENGAPIIARLHRCIDGKTRQRQLLEDQGRLRTAVTSRPPTRRRPGGRATAALVEARRRGLPETTRTSVVTGRTQPHRGTKPRPLTQPFPSPGRRVEQAYRELDVALYGSDEEKKAWAARAACPPLGPRRRASTLTYGLRCGTGSTGLSPGSTTSTSGTSPG